MSSERFGANQQTAIQLQPGPMSAQVQNKLSGNLASTPYILVGQLPQMILTATREILCDTYEQPRHNQHRCVVKGGERAGAQAKSLRVKSTTPSNSVLGPAANSVQTTMDQGLYQPQRLPSFENPAPIARIHSPPSLRAPRTFLQ